MRTIHESVIAKILRHSSYNDRCWRSKLLEQTNSKFLREIVDASFVNIGFEITEERIKDNVIQDQVSNEM